MKIKKEVDGEVDDIELIQNPKKWPCWPFLPMKKRLDNRSLPELGVVEEGEGLSTIVLCTLFDSASTFKKAKRIVYPSVREMVDNGWEVD